MRNTPSIDIPEFHIKVGFSDLTVSEAKTYL